MELHLVHCGQGPRFGVVNLQNTIGAPQHTCCSAEWTRSGLQHGQAEREVLQWLGTERRARPQDNLYPALYVTRARGLPHRLSGCDLGVRRN